LATLLQRPPAFDEIKLQLTAQSKDCSTVAAYLKLNGEVPSRIPVIETTPVQPKTITAFVHARNHGSVNDLT
jgi:hypothetical protein